MEGLTHRGNRNLLLVEGIIFALLGFLAIAMPVISTLGAELFIGWFVLLGGLVQAYRAFKARHEKGFWGSLLTSLIYVIFGILLLANPIAGVISLTILVTFFFIIQGIAQIILGFQLRPFRQWGWFALNGVLALIMAYLIWSGWPTSAFWVIGLLVGINMLFFGISLIFLALNTPRVDKA